MAKKPECYGCGKEAEYKDMRAYMGEWFHKKKQPGHKKACYVIAQDVMNHKGPWG